MTEIDAIKNAQRLYHIENDLSKLDEKARAILKGLPLPKDFTAPQLP